MLNASLGNHEERNEEMMWEPTKIDYDYFNIDRCEKQLL